MAHEYWLRVYADVHQDKHSYQYVTPNCNSHTLTH
jgi:hypothetical protein